MKVEDFGQPDITCYGDRNPSVETWTRIAEPHVRYGMCEKHIADVADIRHQWLIAPVLRLPEQAVDLREVLK